MFHSFRRVIDKNKCVKCYYLNDKQYDYEILDKNLPYIIEFNHMNGDYYFINRDYEYIGFNTKNINDIETNIKFEDEDIFNEYDRKYLFDDGTYPLGNIYDLNEYMKKIITYKVKLNKCKNKMDNLQFLQIY